MWSLGCVFLEFVIWLLYDFSAVYYFEDNRHRFHNGARFYHITGGKAEVTPTVVSAINALRSDPRCEGDTAFTALLDLIEKRLLVIPALARCDAEELQDVLGEIVRKGQEEPSYLFNPAAPPPRIPSVFLDLGVASRLGSATQQVVARR